MADKEFIIEELIPIGSGGNRNGGARFVFTALEHSIPENEWEMPIHQRTSRYDYPGSELPIEQVLGWAYEPFMLYGGWDDRYLGQGAAEQLLEDFTKMVQRGNQVRISFENQTFYGIITSFIPKYKLRSLIRYSFTVSPHFRKRGETVRERKPAAPILDPRTEANAALGRAQSMELAHRRAGGLVNPGNLTLINASLFRTGLNPPFQLKGTAFADVTNFINDMFGAVERAYNSINTNVLDPLTGGVNAVRRTVSRFQDIRTKAANLATRLRSLSSASDLVVNDAIAELEFEAWKRALVGMARLQMLGSHNVIRDLLRKTDPKAKRLYRTTRGESLYDISTRFYGTPHEWRRIAERNNLKQINLLGNELLVIPEKI